jgi:hypothetical protein
MAIRVEYGNPALVGLGAYRAGQGIEDRRLEERAVQVGIQNQQAQDAFQQRVALSGLENQQLQDREAQRQAGQMSYLNAKTDTERQRIEERKSKYDEQRQKIEEQYANGQGKIDATQYQLAMDALNNLYGDVAEVYIPPAAERADAEHPKMRMPDGEEVPVLIDQRGNPDYGRTYAEHVSRLQKQEEIKLKQDEQSHKAELERIKAENDRLRLMSEYERKLLEMTDVDAKGNERRVYTPDEARAAAEGRFGAAEPFWVTDERARAQAGRLIGSRAANSETQTPSPDTRTISSPPLPENDPQVIAASGGMQQPPQREGESALDYKRRNGWSVFTNDRMIPDDMPTPGGLPGLSEVRSQEVMRRLSVIAQTGNREDFNMFIDSLPVDDATKARIAQQAMQGVR